MTETQEKSHWLQDNLRILVSIGIVVLLVMAIYSYSKRNAPSRVVVDDVHTTEDATQVAMTSTDDVSKIITEIKDETEQKDAAAPVAPITQDTDNAETSELQTSSAQETPASEAQEVEQPAADTATQQEQQSQSAHDVVKDVVAARNDDGTISITAVHGDSATTLARKAVAQYASAHSIDDLSGAQKIYMEDYLRRAHSGTRVHPGMTMTFTSAQIDAALTKARALTDTQLSNLDRYARRVSHL